MIKRITNEINYGSAEEPPEGEEIIKRKDRIFASAAAWHGNYAASESRRTDFDPVV